MTSFGQRQTINQPAKIIKAKTWTDNIFANIYTVSAKVIEPNYGDHKALILEISYERKPPSIVKTRKYTPASKTKFIELLKLEEWRMLDEEKDGNRLMNRFVHTFLKHFNASFPTVAQTYQTQTTKISQELQHMRETVKLLMRIHDSKGDQHSYNLLQEYKQYYIKCAEEERKSQNLTVINNTDNKSKTIWNIINREAGKIKKGQHPEAPTPEKLNQFYTQEYNVAQDQTQKISGSMQCSKSVFFHPTDFREVEAILRTIKSKTAEDVYIVYGINT